MFYNVNFTWIIGIELNWIVAGVTDKPTTRLLPIGSTNASSENFANVLQIENVKKS